MRPAKRRRRLRADDELARISAYEAGETICRPASGFGITREKVSGVAEAHSITRRYHQTVHVDLVRAAQLEAQGLTLTAVDAALGIGRTTPIRARWAARQPET